MKTIYQCDGCGKEFSDWKVCSDHENEHIKIKSSQLIFKQEEVHPFRVDIVFSDGSIGNYTLFGNIIAPEEKDLDPALKKFAEIKAAQKESSPAIGSSQESQKEEPFTF